MTAPDLFSYADQYPQAPGFKERGGASEDAAREMYPIAGNLRGAVLDALRAVPGGLTADEVAARLDRSPFAIRPRLSELWKDGRIEKTNGRRRNASGKQAAIWRAIC